MPEMPAFLANLLEPRFARPTHVTAIEDLAPGLRRVRVQGPSLRGVAFKAGQEIETRVSERAFRHYTPSLFDAGSGALEVLFYLHGRGPGSAWAAGLQPGQAVNILGPAGSLGLSRTSREHVFLGDETSLGAFAAMARAAGSAAVTGAIEVEPGHERWPALAGLDLHAVPRAGGDRGGALCEWLGSGPALASEATFYLVGHAGSIVRLRQKLLERGWPRRSIVTKAYWADGRRGL